MSAVLEIFDFPEVVNAKVCWEEAVSSRVIISHISLGNYPMYVYPKYGGSHCSYLFSITIYIIRGNADRPSGAIKTMFDFNVSFYCFRMVRHNKSKMGGSKTKYSPEALKQACSAVMDGRMSQRQASATFAVPKTTLQQVLSGKTQSPGAVGRKTALLPFEEQSLARHGVSVLSRTGAGNRHGVSVLSRTGAGNRHGVSVLFQTEAGNRHGVSVLFRTGA